ncbi:VWA domain-containing protein [Acinetobacter sp. SwsAc6]|uniref:VWA domain-containing protein n=1 Tax=Acinetobacter sp. SwsAc6 TaxID=2749439 RepID=UPI0015C13C38|nr:VWA domain-containing protein [Acinetobacter sp. SwsAc6]NWK74589.1 VWA domain-containing protein [Acinetobacter sp. SwsAc6]
MPALKTASARQTHASIQRLTDQLYGELGQSSVKHWLDDRKVAQKLDERVHEWAYQAKNNLDTQHPYLAEVQQFEFWMAQSEVSATQFQQMQQQYQAMTERLQDTPLLDAWHYADEPLNDNRRQLHFQILKDKWQRKLTEAIAHWEFEQLALMRDAFLQDIQDFLLSLQKMSKHQDSLGADTGIFIDYSSGKLSPQAVEKFAEWSEYLASDVALQRLCKLIGSAQPTHFARKHIATQWHNQPDSAVVEQASDEIAGIQLGRELSWALPNELALLADPDLQILFDLKYLESNISSFHLQGQQASRILHDAKPKQKPVGKKGPMIVCLDTSGSMHGQPELISKAMCLYLSIQALREKRPMYLINFSTHLTAIQLKKGQALDDVIEFLSQSFHGGTDIIPAMQHAVDMLEQPTFRQADIVVISDFIMGQLGVELMQSIEQHKQQGTGFYAVAIGNFRFDHLDQGLFDHQWIYQSATGKVIELPNKSAREIPLK